MTALRDDVLAAFRRMTDLPVAAVTRAGADRLSMVYTLALDTGQELRIDDRTLWSPTEFLRAATVEFGCNVRTGKPADWQHAIQALLIHATDAVATPGETYAETVREWVRRYAERASTDRDGAAASNAPFVDDGYLHVHAGNLAVYVRRELVEQVKLSELYQALRDLGFERRTVHYVRGSATVRRSTASYYRAPLEAIEADDAG